MQTTLINPAELFRLVYFFDILAAVVFAVSGALVASRKGMDVMGFMWLSVITGVGGGTVRDLILDVPVFWVQNPVHVSACLMTAVVMHFVAPLVESRYRTLLWFDAFGLALVTVAGTVKAMDVGAPALVAIAMGAVTGTVGGMIRDTLGHVPSVLLRHEIYVTASVLGACTYVGLDQAGVERLPAMIGAFLTTFTVRGLAIRYGWSLPVFRASETRERWRNDRKDSGQG
ncbi:MAG: trimeric intracellular cation channel family protein [Vicinamibacterales bacterium]